MSVCACVYIHMCMPCAHSVDNLGKLVLFTSVGSRWPSQLVKHGGKHLYPMRHLNGPVYHFLWNKHSKYFFLAFQNLQHVVTIVALLILLSILFMLCHSNKNSLWLLSIVQYTLPRLSLLPTLPAGVTSNIQILRSTFSYSTYE